MGELTKAQRKFLSSLAGQAGGTTDLWDGRQFEMAQRLGKAGLVAVQGMGWRLRVTLTEAGLTALTALSRHDASKKETDRG